MTNPQEEITKTGTPNQLIQLLYFKLEVLKMAEGIWKNENVTVEDIPRTITAIYDKLMWTMEEGREKTPPAMKNIINIEIPITGPDGENLGQINQTIEK